MTRTKSTARCHLGLGLALLMLHQLEQVPPKVRADVLVEQGLARGEAELEEAVPPFRAALELYEQAGDLRGQAECRLFLATVEEQRGNMAAAAANLDAALDFLRPLDDPIGVWLTLLLRGKAEADVGRCRQAPASFEEALDTIRRVVEDDRLLGLETMAAYSRQTYCPNALDMQNLSEVHPMIYRLVVRRLEALTLELAAAVHRDAGHLETALTLWQEALGNARGMMLSGSIGYVHHEMGKIHLALGRHGEAAEHLGRALEDARRSARWEDEVAILRELADVECRRNRLDEALARYDEILEIADLVDVVEIASQTREDIRQVEGGSCPQDGG